MNETERFKIYLNHALNFFDQCLSDAGSNDADGPEYYAGMREGHKRINALARSCLSDVGPSSAEDIDSQFIMKELDRQKTVNPYREFLMKLIPLLIREGREAKKRAQVDQSSNYGGGYVMAFYQLVDTLKDYAAVNGITEEELGLNAIDPDKEL